MYSYYMCLEVKDGKLKELMDRINKAQDEICDCYRELQEMGVVKIAPADEKPGQEINDPARK